jgi:hypothetical protein
MFPGDGESFVLALHGCQSFSLTTDDGEEVSSIAEIERRSPEILSVISEDPLSIYTTCGTLTTTYSSATLSLDSGEPVSPEDVDAASGRYWEQWSKRQGGSV